MFQKFSKNKNGRKNNLRIIKKKFAADQEKGFPTKLILKPFGLKSPIRQRVS